MATIDLRLDGDGAFADLEPLMRQGKVIHLADNATVRLAALAGGMQSGRASVAFGLALPDGRWVFWETSLRLLWNCVTAVAARYGEPYMQSPMSERDHKQALAMASLAKQLTDAQRRLGEPATFDLREADATWEREQQLREALARARSALVSGEALSPALEAAIDAALAGKKAAAT